MTKEDLVTGHIIEIREGNLGLVVKNNVYGKDAIIFHASNWTPLDGFNKKLYWYGYRNNRTSYSKNVDIMKVYEPLLPSKFFATTKPDYNLLKLIWERKKPETIEIDGKKYIKSEVIERLNELEPL